MIGRGPAIAGAVRPDPPPGAARAHRAHHRRDRQRQGARRARAAPHRARGASKRFVVVNCSAVVETLFESELFGHVRGAFTGATETTPGLFELADGGTIFLDEVGELPLTVQAKLLRVLETGEVQRVGAARRRAAWTCTCSPPPTATCCAEVGGQAFPQRPLLPPQRRRARACRRCASGARTFRIWSPRSCATRPRGCASRCSGSRRPPSGS